MPKFNLYSIANHPAGSQEYRCELGWSRDGRVTLGVTSIAAGADRLEEYLPPPATSTTIKLTVPAVKAGEALTVLPDTLQQPAQQYYLPASTTVSSSTPVQGWMRLSAGRGQEATIAGPDGVHELVPAWQGWHMPLDRQQINQLIIELRRARDVAYGRDQ